MPGSRRAQQLQRQAGGRDRVAAQHLAVVVPGLELHAEMPPVADVIEGREEAGPGHLPLPQQREDEGLAEHARPTHGVLEVEVPDARAPLAHRPGDVVAHQDAVRGVEVDAQARRVVVAQQLQRRVVVVDEVAEDALHGQVHAGLLGQRHEHVEGGAHHVPGLPLGEVPAQAWRGRVPGRGTAEEVHRRRHRLPAQVEGGHRPHRIGGPAEACLHAPRRPGARSRAARPTR